MVFMSGVSYCVKTGMRKFLRRKFMDSLRLHVSGGSGGMGLPKYGGIGGDGGDVLIEGCDNLTLRDTLKQAKEKRVKAGCGENSHKNRIVGSRGEDLVLTVPVGVTVVAEDGTKLGEVNAPEQRVIVAKGGTGGSKDNLFNGSRGQAHSIVLDLKLIADVGLVGFPNAGKSTILSIISNAKPKIASYPFTTIHPNIGLVQYPDLRSLSVADLPGLIEGSHLNFGMGHKFLKHVERTKLLLVVVDISGFKLSYKYKSHSALETLILLNRELELYREDILDKPAILVINKMDAKNSARKYDDLLLALEDYNSVMSLAPENYRPTRPFVFERTLKMTAAEKNQDEIELLKSTVRDVLDAHDTIDLDAEIRLSDRLDSQLSVRGPALA